MSRTQIAKFQNQPLGQLPHIVCRELACHSPQHSGTTGVKVHLPLQASPDGHEGLGCPAPDLHGWVIELLFQDADCPGSQGLKGLHLQAACQCLQDHLLDLLLLGGQLAYQGGHQSTFHNPRGTCGAKRKTWGSGSAGIHSAALPCPVPQAKRQESEDGGAHKKGKCYPQQASAPSSQDSK